MRCDASGHSAFPSRTQTQGIFRLYATWNPHHVSLRTTLAKVLQAAIEHGYLETNPAGGIQIGEREPKSQKLASIRTGSEEPVFCTATGTPLNPKNLYNRVLAPTCDRIGPHRVSWHCFWHINATLLGEVGESLKTAQSILGHSDLETTLNTYMHAIPDSQLACGRTSRGGFVPRCSPNACGLEQSGEGQQTSFLLLTEKKW